MAECKKCIHKEVCKTAESCDGYVSGCEHFKEGWISVKERLPENGEEVITHRKSGMNVENRFNKDWCFDEFCDCPVTHWMPLPESPKGE